MPSEVIIINAIPNKKGWAPVYNMVFLAAQLLEAEIIHISLKDVKVNFLLKQIVKRNRNKNKPNAIIITPIYSQLHYICSLPKWRNSFNQVAAWIFDSFWTDRINPYPISRTYDHLFITSGGDIDEYQTKSHVKTTFLPWGTDALGIGASTLKNRSIDILRVGRQPIEWNDDQVIINTFDSIGIKYHGRPPSFEDLTTHQGILLNDYLKKSKFVTAHSNLIDQSTYTHPTKEYITARWTDSLACGCSIIGVPPKTDIAYKELLWPEATVELETTSLEGSFPIIREAVNNWTPNKAHYNYLMSLKRLDWRWRFKIIMDIFEAKAPKLDADLEKLRNIIN